MGGLKLLYHPTLDSWIVLDAHQDIQDMSDFAGLALTTCIGRELNCSGTLVVPVVRLLFPLGS